MQKQLHKDEILISTDLVRNLIDSQFPDYAYLPLVSLTASGSSNVQYRLGDDLLVRLPRLEGGSRSIEKEYRWTSKIGIKLPVSVPEIVALGEPALGYSESWSILHWLPGELPEVCSSDNSSDQEQTQLATDFAALVRAFRDINVPGNVMSDKQFDNYRGRPLKQYDRHMRRNLQRCKSLANLDLDIEAASAIWQNALTLPEATEVQHWYHGDLVAENLLVNNGQLTGVLDFGGLGIGDSAIDLHGAWELFDAPARQTFRTLCGVDDNEWYRGRAWALAVAFMTFDYYWTTMPDRIRDRLAMAHSVLADVDELP